YCTFIFILLLVVVVLFYFFFFFSSRRRHTRWPRDWSSDVCSFTPGEACCSWSADADNCSITCIGSMMAGIGPCWSGWGSVSNQPPASALARLGCLRSLDPETLDGRAQPRRAAEVRSAGAGAGLPTQVSYS